MQALLEGSRRLSGVDSQDAHTLRVQFLPQAIREADQGMLSGCILSRMGARKLGRTGINERDVSAGLDEIGYQPLRERIGPREDSPPA